MRKKIVFMGLLLMAVLVLGMGETGVAFADEGPPALHQAITEFTGSETCAMCHPAAAREVVESLHYQPQDEAPHRESWEEDVLGDMKVIY